MKSILTLLMALATAACLAGPRARDLGVPFDGEPGPLNAITDVEGVAVGHATLIQDLSDGRKVRTGVTAILPRGRDSFRAPVFGGWYSLNGNGEMTGTTWLEESGELDGPVMITNTTLFRSPSSQVNSEGFPVVRSIPSRYVVAVAHAI